ncbi:hypothetical protein Tco_0115730 [Tanacetum coccineum]
MFDCSHIEDRLWGLSSTLDAKTRTLRAEVEQDTQDVYDVIEDTQDRQTQLFQRVDGLVKDGQFHYETARLLDQEDLLSAALGQIQALQARGQTHADNHEGIGTSMTVGLVFSFLVSDNHSNSHQVDPLGTARSANSAARADAAAAASPIIVACCEQLIKARVSAALANHETLQNSTNGQGDGSHNSDTGIRGTVRTPRDDV